MARLHEVLVSPLLGGASLLAIRLAEAAKRRHVACTAWVPGSGPASAELQAHGVDWRTYNLEAMKMDYVRQLAACARLSAGLIGRHRALVHVHNPTVYRLLRPALVAATARVIVHFHIEPSDDDIRWTLEYPPDCVLTCAQYIADAIKRAQPALSERVHAIPNAIDVERFHPVASRDPDERSAAPSREYVLLMMANLSPHKGQATAIQALRALADRGIAAECWLAGEDRTGSNYAAELLRLARELLVADRVKFLGFRSDVPELIRSADVLLLPSSHEGLPLTILEAQAAKVPVVASTIPGVREVVEDGITGFTVEATDSDGYADRIAALLTNNQLRDAITAAARARVLERHSWPAYEGRIYDVYRSFGAVTA